MVLFSSSEKIKRRYLLVKGSRETIERAILDYVGLLGWARAAPVFISAGDGMWICAVERKELMHIRAALAVAEETLTIVRVSGTLHGLGVKIPRP